MTNDAICLERARRFSDELIANTESHLQIGEEYGPAVLGLCLYLQQTLLDGLVAQIGELSSQVVI